MSFNEQILVRKKNGRSLGSLPSITPKNIKSNSLTSCHYSVRPPFFFSGPLLSSRKAKVPVTALYLLPMSLFYIVVVGRCFYLIY